MKNKYFIAICKKTKKVFKDYKNSSGVLTQHLLNIYPDLIHPSNFLKRQYKKNNQKYWHEKFFDIIENTEEVFLKECPYCNWKTKDLENKSGQYTYHLLIKHNITIEKYISEFPSEIVLFETFIKEKNNKNKMLSDKNNFIICKMCGQKMKTLTNTHLKKHKITLEEYKIKFPGENYHSNEFINKTSKNLKIASKKIKKSYVSRPESSLKEFLSSLNIKFDNNNRKFLQGVEIDIINHENKIGIEFNGNLYHSENYGGKLKNFHINKTKLMNKKGYSLIHITEDEWGLKQDIVKNKLKHIFNKSTGVKIHARKCIIKEVNSNIKNNFLNKNHIQGEDKCTVSIGAYYEDNLISIMTFDNNRQMSIKNKITNNYELKRFCVSSEYIVNGVFGKLLSYFIKNYNPKKIISFADGRWTLDKDNNLYTKLNFSLVKILPPDYSYYNSKIHRFKRFHKFSFGKSSIKKKFPEIYSDFKTEWDMMQELGYDRIWDCGKFKYEINL